MQSIYITTYSLARSSLEDADIVIEPDVAHIGAGDFQKAPELIKRGEAGSPKRHPRNKEKAGKTLEEQGNALGLLFR